MSLNEIFRANLVRAVGASDLSLEEISAATGIPVNKLRDQVLGGGDAEVEIRDAYRVYRALYPDDPLRFHEWFDEPQSLMPDELDTSTCRGETQCRASAGSAQEE